MREQTDEFNRLYTMLNPEQRDAVDTIEGPVMVIAGPGTGKTQILTLRIANILKETDIPADAILALTFTNAAASNMRKRLVSIIGSDAYRVSIFTFHSFANHLIENYPEQFSEIVGRSNCSEVERIDIVRTLVQTGHFEILRPLGDPYHNVPQIIQALSHLKSEGITPTAYKTWLTKERKQLENTDGLYHTKGAHKGKMKSVYIRQFKSLDKNEELAHLYERYQKELARRKRYDFDDSLLMLIDKLETSEDFLRELQEEFQYFLVDEHQDTNGAQNRILELLVSYYDTPNLFVVGDEKQAIFRFQGASLANFLYFEKKYKDVRRITLSTNYRSGQGILDAAHTLIEKNTEGIDAPLVSHDTESLPEKINVYTFDADDEELLFLAESIQSLIQSGVPAHEIAVLYRNNSDVEAIADYFERLSIPFLIASGHGVLDDPDIRKINQIITVLHDLSNDDALAKVLFTDFLNIPVEETYEVLHFAKKQKMSLFKALSSYVSKKKAKGKDDALSDFKKKLIRWKKRAENESFLLLFEAVVRESGLLNHIQQSTFHTEKFDKLVRLFDEIKALVRRNTFFTIEDYVTFLEILKEHNLTLEAQSRQVPNSIRLMTAHKAKGLEFDYVFIVHAYDGHWGGKRKRQYFQLPYRNQEQITTHADTEDERRLFYVSITRARKRVYISYSSLAPDGKDRVPTQFIEEIHKDLLIEKNSTELGYAGKRPPLFVERKGIHGKERYLEFVRATFDERGLSATAINNFLTCPWKWFYENFFHTQFVPTISQQKGTAVHKTLELFFGLRNKGKQPTADDLVRIFTEQIGDEDIEPQALEKVVRDMSEALRGWYSAREMRWAEKTKNEFLVKGVLLDDTIRLTGKLDMLECLDEKCKEVRVVDFKTGKPKSRNDMEGKTKSSQYKMGGGGYKRQLIFYKLLLNRYNEGMYQMKDAVIDFIEPMQSGKHKPPEVFEISASDVRELEDTIRTIRDDIYSLDFWDTRCDDASCTACALRDVMGTSSL
jgi:DNA helicase-2/ATP-dependent DNA helicase PcrA